MTDTHYVALLEIKHDLFFDDQNYLGGLLLIFTSFNSTIVAIS